MNYKISMYRIVFEEPGRRVRYYCGFDSRKCVPVLSYHFWAAIQFDTQEQAETCNFQLERMNFRGRVVNGVGAPNGSKKPDENVDKSADH